MGLSVADVATVSSNCSNTFLTNDVSTFFVNGMQHLLMNQGIPILDL